MKKYTLFYGFLLITGLVMGLLVFTRQPVAAGGFNQQGDVPLGGALYDKWYAVLGIDPPNGNHPIWERQTSNTRSGPDTWRCVSCHGWDYQGKDGAYRSGQNYTGFPGILQTSQEMSVGELVDVLKGKADPAHDFSRYIDDTHLNALAQFLKNALIDDNEYIDPVSLKVKNGDSAHGQQLYSQSCAECHGADGKQIVFRFEGTRAYLGTLAVLDPWRFLHKTRFGTPGTPMVIGYDLGWKPQDGRDVLLYAQGLPAGQAPAELTPALSQARATPAPDMGGPATNWFTGILTALGVMVAGLGGNILVFAAAIGVILLLVWLLRARR